MIIDQLPAIASPQAADEIPIERGTTTYKIRYDDFGQPLQDQIDAIETDVGDVSNLTTAATNCVDAINEVKTSLNKVENRSKNKFNSVIFLGDSYADSSRGFSTWVDYLKQYIGNPTSVTLAQGGAGFVGAGGATPWNTRLSTQASSMTQAQREAVDGIIVAGGFNDRGVTSEATLDSAIEQFASVAETQFPNAHIYLAFVGWACDTDSTEAFNLNIITNPVIKCYRNCGQFGIKYLTNCEYAMHDMALFDTSETNIVHPNSAGGKAIAVAMFSAINGSGSVFKPFVTTTRTTSQYVFAIDGFAVRQELDNGVIHISMPDYKSTIAFNNVTVAQLKQGIPLMDITGGNYCFGGVSFRAYLPLIAQVKFGSNIYTTVPLTLMFHGKTLMVKCGNFIASTSGGISDSTTVTQMWLSANSWTIPTLS